MFEVSFMTLCVRVLPAHGVESQLRVLYYIVLVHTQNTVVWKYGEQVCIYAVINVVVIHYNYRVHLLLLFVKLSLHNFMDIRSGCGNERVWCFKLCILTIAYLLYHEGSGRF